MFITRMVTLQTIVPVIQLYGHEIVTARLKEIKMQAKLEELEERVAYYRKGYRILLAYLIFDVVFKFFVYPGSLLGG